MDMLHNLLLLRTSYRDVDSGLGIELDDLERYKGMGVLENTAFDIWDTLR